MASFRFGAVLQILQVTILFQPVIKAKCRESYYLREKFVWKKKNINKMKRKTNWIIGVSIFIHVYSKKKKKSWRIEFYSRCPSYETNGFVTLRFARLRTKVDLSLFEIKCLCVCFCWCSIIRTKRKKTPWLSIIIERSPFERYYCPKALKSWIKFQIDEKKAFSLFMAVSTLFNQNQF